MGRAIEITHVKIAGSAATFLAGQRLTRRPGGQISKIVTIRGDGTTGTVSGGFTGVSTLTQEFEHDSLARLVREVRGNAREITDIRYEYDLVGNRTKKTVTSNAGTEITTYSYDDNDRLLEERTSLATGGTRLTTYTWDANGNIASKTEAGRVKLYRFDPRNKLIDIRIGETRSAAEAAAPLVRYAYDNGGNRIRKWAAETSSYLIDINNVFTQVARETVGADSSVDYVRGVGLIRQIKTGPGGTEDIYPLEGHLGTSIGAIDADGELIEQLDSDAFGNADRPNSKLAHSFVGEYWDRDSELLYLRARWYDPKLGRFVSADPLEGMQADPRTLNRYSYAHGDPLHMLDPSGAMSMGEVAAVSGAIGVLAGSATYIHTRSVKKAIVVGSLTGIGAYAIGASIVGITSASASAAASIQGAVVHRFIVSAGLKLMEGRAGANALVAELTLLSQTPHGRELIRQAHYVVSKLIEQSGRAMPPEFFRIMQNLQDLTRSFFR